MDSIPKAELKSAPPMPENNRESPHLMPEMGGALLTPALSNADMEQFPVLKAFQTYLEEERERARRRVVIVSASAILAIVVIVAIFLVVGSIVVGGLMKRNDQLLAAMISNATSAPPVVVQAAPQAAPAPSLDEDKLAGLEKANAALAQQVQDLQKLPNTLAEQMSAVIASALAQSEAEREAREAQAQKGAPEKAPDAEKAPVLVAPQTAPAVEATPVAPSVVAQESPAVEDVAKPNAEPAPVVPVVKVQELKIKPTENAKPMMNGYRGEQLVLETDAGVKIPWRIVVEE